MHDDLDELVRATFLSMAWHRLGQIADGSKHERSHIKDLHSIVNRLIGSVRRLIEGISQIPSFNARVLAAWQKEFPTGTDFFSDYARAEARIRGLCVAWRDEPLAGPATPRSTPLTPADQARLWDRLGATIFCWRECEPKIRSLCDRDAGQGNHAEFFEKVDSLLTSIKQRREPLPVTLFYVPSAWRDDPDERMFSDATALLQQCKKTIEEQQGEIEAHRAAHGLERLVPLIDAIDHAIKAAGDSWPARLWADLLANCSLREKPCNPKEAPNDEPLGADASAALDGGGERMKFADRSRVLLLARLIARCDERSFREQLHRITPFCKQLFQSSDVAAGYRAFVRLHKPLKNEPVSASPGLWACARSLYLWLSGLAPPIGQISPRLDRWTLVADQLTSPLADAEIEWNTEGLKRGAVLEIKQFGGEFGDGVVRAKLLVGAGELPELAKKWLKLPPLKGVASPPGGPRAESLVKWCEDLGQLPWCDAAEIGKRLTGFQTEFRKWLNGEVGRKWLNAFARDLIKASKGDLHKDRAEWFKFLSAYNYLQCFPTIDLQSGWIRWPIEEIEWGSNIEWEFDKEPEGFAVNEDVTFAASPQSARGTFSLGLQGKHRTLDAAEQVAAAAAELDDASLRSAVNALRRSTIQLALQYKELVRPEELLIRCLNSLQAISPAPGGKGSASAAACDRILAALRDWCGRLNLNLEIFPRKWIFAEPVYESSISPDEREFDPPQFDDGVGLGQIRLRSFGYGGGEAPRKTRVSVSAGMTPPGYIAMQQVIAEHAAAPLDPIKALLDQWPERTIDESLQELAENCHVEFWKCATDDFRAAQVDLFERAKSALEELLRAAAGLEMVYPENIYNDRHGLLGNWYDKPRRDGGEMTGRVTHVVRPALVKDKMVRTTAMIEVE